MEILTKKLWCFSEYKSCLSWQL